MCQLPGPAPPPFSPPNYLPFITHQLNIWSCCYYYLETRLTMTFTILHVSVGQGQKILMVGVTMVTEMIKYHQFYGVINLPLFSLCLYYRFLPMSVFEERQLLKLIQSCPEAVENDPVAKRFRRKLLVRQVSCICLFQSGR